MRLVFRFTGLLLLVFILSGCSSSMELSSNYDKNEDFSIYETYMLLPWRKENSKLVNEIDRRRFYEALKNEMDSRGYKEVKSGGDLAVNLMVIIQEGSDVSAYRSHYNHGGYYYPYGYGYSTVQYSSQEYLQGTIIIDMFNNKGKKLIWQGAAVGRIDENPRNREHRIKKTLSKIFWEFPVKKNKK